MATVSRTTTIYGTGANRVDLYMSVKEVSVNDDGSRNLKAYLALKCYGYSGVIYKITDAYVDIDGTKVGRRFSGSKAISAGETWYMINGADYVAPANADGTGSVTCRGYFNSYSTSSATLTLESIPQLGTGAFSPNPATVNTNNGTTVMTLTVTPRNPDYFHYVKISTGGLAYITQAWAEDNANTFPVTDLNILSNTVNAAKATGNVSARIETYDQKSIITGTLIGYVVVYGAWTIDTSVIHPNITIDAISPLNSPISGQIVAGYSGAQIDLLGLGFGTNVQASLSKGTVASANRTKVSTAILPASDTDYTVTATIVATDQRGASDTETATFTVKGYKRPIPKLTAYRVASTASTTYDEAGEYVYVAWSNTITALGSNSVQSESVTYSGDISGTLSTSPSWVALGQDKGATFEYTVTDLVTSGTIKKSVPVAIFPLDLYQDTDGIGAAFGGTAVPGLVRSFQPFSAHQPIVTDDSHSSVTLDTRSGVITRGHYNGAQSFVIPDGTPSGWWAVVIRSRNNDTTFVCSGSDGLVIAGESSIPTSYATSGLGTYLIIRIAGTRLALSIDVGAGGGGGTVAWTDITGKPSFAAVATSGNYSDLNGTPSLATVATSGLYSDLSGTPSLATVATSGDYDDLTDKPTIPSQGQMWFGTSSTGGSTVKKESSITGFPATLTNGLLVAVRFANANTASSPTLSINSGTAVAIRRYGTTAPSTSAALSWQAGTVVLMCYYSSYWYIVNWLNTTYSEISAANIANTTSSTTGLITGRRFKAGFDALLTSTAITTELGFTPQDAGNLVTSVSSASTDAQYPSAKLFYDTVGDIETLLQALR